MRKLFTFIIILTGILVGTSLQYSVFAEEEEGPCGSCFDNPNFPGLSYCNFLYPGGSPSCGSNTGAVCGNNCGLGESD